MASHQEVGRCEGLGRVDVVGSIVEKNKNQTPTTNRQAG
jgi:hypothetical protein